MTTTIPLSALATCENDTKFTKKFLFPKDDRLHRDMEYMWGLDAYTIDPTHERSILEIRSSMQVPFADGGNWALVPTEETLVAMRALQVHNTTVPISERKSFLTEFAAPEYEYIFVPLRTNVTFFIMRPGRDAQQFSAPYADFPRVTSSANPFFATFDSRLKIPQSLFSETWNMVFGRLTMHWYPGVIPKEFFHPPCYPETLISESEDESEPDTPPVDPETIVTPIEEGSWPVPGKKTRVCEWVRKDAKRPRMDTTLCSPPPPTPQKDRKKKFYDTVRAGPRWPVESKRGKGSPHVLLVTALS
ncbi:hypothetical protein MSAN_00736100 [Mycena sanguinolenta]|uniref:Uncharacterized protein n=1 Tax=Mycena sanguinolenta TaxID=230812 RepID=A0A8H7DD29_9AGAR|nr:hypothetical protein MSAN_00736100 [Mycena sanguinolenta]